MTQAALAQRLSSQADPAEQAARMHAELAMARDEKRSRTAAQLKLDSQLLFAMRLDRGEPAVKGLPFLRAEVKREKDQRVKVEIRATVTPALLAKIAKLNGTVTGSYPKPGFINATVPLKALEPIAAESDVKFIEPARPPVARVGAVTSEGDKTHMADAARAAYCADGSGVKIGVISDGVDTLASSQGTGIGDGELGNVTVLQGREGTGNEGTAMLEIIHDIAPGASLYFASGNASLSVLADSIIALLNAGCNIIVDDLGSFGGESPFQDDAVAQAVTTVSDAGVLYFSAAGNDGNKDSNTSSVWEGDYQDSLVHDPRAGDYELHEFGDHDFVTCAPIDKDDKTVTVDLWWSDPLGGSGNDYDLYSTNAAGNIIHLSAKAQTGTQDPHESIQAAPGEHIFVAKSASAASRFLRLTATKHPLSASTCGSTVGHSASGAANAFCVAAAPAVGPFPNAFSVTSNYEDFSSDGPRRIFFTPNGGAITPGNFSSTGGRALQKPDITAADGVSTSVGGFSPFFGTSAAAPHAAAIAALIKSVDGSLTPAQIRAALMGTAIDIGQAGFDRDTGAGLVMPLAALQSVYTPSAYISVADSSGPEPVGDPGALNYNLQPIPFTITLGRASAQAVTVHVATQDNTAKAGTAYPADYVAVSTDVTFNPGETSKQINVSPADGDRIIDGDKTFYVNLSNPVGASICRGKAIGTIYDVNSDQVPCVSVRSPSVIEASRGDETGGTVNAVFLLGLTEPSDRFCTVDYSTADNSALSGKNYSATSGTVTFAPGEVEKAVFIDVLDDGIRGELPVTFAVNLQNPHGMKICGAQGVCTIFDLPIPPDPPPSVFAGENSIVEGTSGTAALAIPIRLSAPSAQEVKVSFITSPTGMANSATENVDYQAAGGTLTFNPGQVDQVAVVPVIGDADSTNEPNKQFYVVLSNPVNATLGNTIGVGTIIDPGGATPTPTPTPGGTPTPPPTPPPTPTPTPNGSPTPTPGPVQETQNISARLGVGTGEYVAIGGFIVNGTGSKRVIVRAIGPSLVNEGVPGALGGTSLQLYDSAGNVVASNDDWQAGNQAQEIADSGLAPTGIHESAIIATLPTGNYTAILSGRDGTTGIALVEVYDLDQAAASRLANISTRGYIGTGDGVLIGGFIVGTQGEFIIRAIGPSLTTAGVGNALGDPMLELYNAQGTLIDQNDDWQQNPYAQLVMAAGLAPGDTRESALIYIIPPGNYTAIVRGVNGTTGVGLVEVYNLQ